MSSKTSLGSFPSVAIVIPAYNASKYIRDLIDACLTQDYPGLIEVIIVDDGSTDHTSEIVKSYPTVGYIYQKNSGPSSARNKGWRASRSDIICFTDSDCVPNISWVSNIINSYVSADIAGVGGSYAIQVEHNLLASCIHEEIIYRHRKMKSDALFLGSYNASYRRSVLEDVGGFDEIYTMASGEDNDLSYKVIKKGYKLVFNNKNTVLHHHPTSLMSYLRRQFWHGYWRMKMYKDHPDMVVGDGYSGIADFIQPPLYLLMALLFLFSWVRPLFLFGLLLLLVGFLFQVPICSNIILSKRDFRFVLLAPLIVLRGLVRAVGMSLGIMKYFIFNHVPQIMPDQTRE